ncbi:MAG: type II secretion system protein [Planctomycetes bacterium]|nr:type II secretion system protein [Planctomycetota bacterium]
MRNTVNPPALGTLPCPRRRGRVRAFSLVELLTVIFIISLLIAILVPSLSAARNQAKKTVTKSALNAIETGLQMFQNDNASSFPQTNGFPPSFSHPPLGKANFESHLGQFPFLPNPHPLVYGAHWLPAMLMGVDLQGYVQRRSVPRANNLRDRPWLWYTPDPTGDGKLIPRAPLYADPGNLRTVATKDLPGRPNRALFPNWTAGTLNELDMQDLPVIVDAWDQPILYYAANTHGRASNMVADVHFEKNSEYTGGPQETGPPVYFHQDNEGFTGNAIDAEGVSNGWDFGGGEQRHTMALSGAKLSAQDLIDPANRDTFARYVVDRKIFGTLTANTPETAPLRPVNRDTYLLISPGVDGRYGTNDDVSNLPPWPNN